LRKQSSCYFSRLSGNHQTQNGTIPGGDENISYSEARRSATSSPPLHLFPHIFLPTQDFIFETSLFFPEQALFLLLLSLLSLTDLPLVNLSQQNNNNYSNSNFNIHHFRKPFHKQYNIRDFLPPLFFTLFYNLNLNLIRILYPLLNSSLLQDFHILMNISPFSWNPMVVLLPPHPHNSIQFLMIPFHAFPCPNLSSFWSGRFL